MASLSCQYHIFLFCYFLLHRLWTLTSYFLIYFLNVKEKLLKIPTLSFLVAVSRSNHLTFSQWLSAPIFLSLILTCCSLPGQFHSGGRQHGRCVHDQDCEQHLRRGLCQCSSGQGVCRPLSTEGQITIVTVGQFYQTPVSLSHSCSKLTPHPWFSTTMN